MNLRHGDLAFIQVKELPKGLIKSSSKVFMKGSNNNNHTYDAGDWYPTTIPGDNFTIGFFVSKKTTLFHVEHGMKIKGQELRITGIDDQVSRLARQNQDTHAGMVPVLD